MKGQLQTIGEPTDAVALSVARDLKADWLALVRFDPKDNLHALYSIELVHIVAQKVASRASALFGIIRTSSATLADDFARAASRARDALTSQVRKLQRIWVVLNLYSEPPEADFYFGNSSSRTNQDGIGRWEGTLPPGMAKLRVSKQPGYAERAIDIVVPATECSPCVLRYQTVHLVKAP